MKSEKVINVINYEDNGNVFWYKPGTDILHREDGPAVEWSNGDKYWYINGKYHRENGPAVEYIRGDKFWFINGKRHREHGPAVEYSNGNKEYWLNDQKYSYYEWLAALNPILKAFI